MKEISASACAKSILFGEHAVVYGEPAIAVPLAGLRTYAAYTPGIVGIFSDVLPGKDLSNEPAVGELLRLFSETIGISEPLTGTLRIRSDIPMAAGLGSGAALSCAILRCLASLHNLRMSPEELNRLVYACEKIYHGNPSGVDNTVICYEQPLFFIRGEQQHLLDFDLGDLPLLVIDSGIRSRTVDVVSDVRAHYDTLSPVIREIGELVRSAEAVLRSGDPALIGQLMNKNQDLLRALTVSCRELDELTALALREGAYGAKLTGAGRGGNFIVMAKDTDHAAYLRDIYRKKGLRVIL